MKALTHTVRVCTVKLQGKRGLLPLKRTAWVLAGLIMKLPLMRQSISNWELITMGEYFCNYGLRENTTKTSVSETLQIQQHNDYAPLLWGF